MARFRTTASILCRCQLALEGLEQVGSYAIAKLWPTHPGDVVWTGLNAAVPSAWIYSVGCWCGCHESSLKMGMEAP